ncbi:MAG: hypothetical protein JKY43_07345 [Phycisphaerales bacterium]|nr:hypothetical protein [Phycisphaerales bacterium]
MKYVHPDIVIGEAIPEIELRIDYERLAVVRRLNIWWRWCLVFSLALTAVSVILRPGFIIGIGMVAVVLVLWIVPLFGRSIRAQRRRMREANRLQKSTSSNFWNIPFRDLTETQIMILGLMVIFLFLNNVSGGLGSILSIFGIYAFMGGIGIIAYGYHARQPGQISCVKCSYPLVGLTIDCRCPECGIFILSPLDTSDCPRIRSPWFWRIGLTMSILGGVLTYINYANPAAFYAPVPRAVLLKLAPTDREAFERIVSNPMSQEQTDELIEKLVSSDIHRDSAYMSYWQRQWLSEQFVAGLLSDDQANRVLELADDIWIKAPATGRVGEPITLGLNTNGDFDAGGGMKPRYYFGGFVIGEDPTPHQRGTNLRSISLITEQIKDSIRSLMPESHLARIEAMKPPVYVFIPEQPGVVTIRVRLVLAILPVAGPQTIDWENGDQRFQTQPLWVRTIDLEHTITIEPASGSDDGG